MLQVDDGVMDSAVGSGDEAIVSALCDRAAMFPKKVSMVDGNGAMCTSPPTVANCC